MTALTPSRLSAARERLIAMHFAAKTGHLGGNLSCLDAMMLVHHEFLGPDDRFVLSKGHSAGALYVTQWSLGRIPDEALATFHQDGTALAGHPPSHGVPGVEFATGSLGHGLSLAAGLALAARLRGSSRQVFCLTSDGEWQEGSTWEALIFAAHHRLSALTVVIDQNGLQGFGTTREVASLDRLQDVITPFAVEVRCADGHDLDAMRAAIGRPHGPGPLVVVLATRKGNGIPSHVGRMDSHYLPLTREAFAGRTWPGRTEAP
jgi:transketolase